MRILMTAHNLVPASYAGVEIHTHELASGLVARGHDVTVVVPSNDRLRAASSQPYRLRLLNHATNWTGAETKSVQRRRQIWKEFADVADDVKPDLIHAQHALHLGWQWLAEIPSLRRPVILTLADYWLLCPNIYNLCKGEIGRCARECCQVGWRRPLTLVQTVARLRSRRRQIRDLLNLSTAPLATCSFHVADAFESFGVARDRLITMPPGSSTAAAAVPSVHPSTGPLRFVYVGNLAPHKGVETLIEAWQEYDGRGTLEIYGSGDHSYIQKLQHLSRGSSVKFMGRYDHSSLPAIFSIHDVVVVPPTWDEPYGLTVQEALIAGLPVIASDVGGISGRVVDGLNGLLFPRGDASALAARFRKLSAGGVERFRAGSFGVRTIDADAAEWESLYDWTAGRWPELASRTARPAHWPFKADAALLSNLTGQAPGFEYDRLVHEYSDPGGTVRDAWNANPPSTPNEVDEFYRSTDSYLYDLLVVRHSRERRQWRDEALRLLVDNSVTTLLDYGGGCGTDAIWFAAAGIRVTLFDIGQQNLRLAKLRAATAGQQIDITAEFPATVTFDAVHCTEVLEHVPDPIGLMRKVIGVLRPGGVALVTHSFDLVDDRYPSHLPTHQGLSRSFIGLVEQLGAQFVECVHVPGNTYLVFQKCRSKVEAV